MKDKVYFLKCDRLLEEIEAAKEANDFALFTIKLIELQALQEAAA
jgi:hypothetical protein